MTKSKIKSASCGHLFSRSLGVDQRNRKCELCGAPEKLPALSKKQAPTLKMQIKSVQAMVNDYAYHSVMSHDLDNLKAACTTLIAIERIGEKKILLLNDLIERNEDFLKEFEHSSEDALSLHSHIGRIRSILNKMK